MFIVQDEDGKDSNFQVPEKMYTFTHYYKDPKVFESMAKISDANEYDVEFKFSTCVDDPEGNNFETPLRSPFLRWSIEVDDPKSTVLDGAYSLGNGKDIALEKIMNNEFPLVPEGVSGIFVDGQPIRSLFGRYRYQTCWHHRRPVASCK